MWLDGAIYNYDYVDYSYGNYGYKVNLVGYIFSYQLIVYNGQADYWWLRSPDTDVDNDVWYVDSGGGVYSWGIGSSYGRRPAFVLPSSLYVSDDGSVRVDFLGYHHYLTESGAVIQKLRHSSVKKVKQRIKDWRYLYENHLISSQEIKASFLAWDAFAAYGDTYELRRNLADKVENLIHESITIHRKFNPTRHQREARRQKQERCIAENRRRQFEKDSIEFGYYHPEAFEEGSIEDIDSSSSYIPEVKKIISDIENKNKSRSPNSMPYISNVLIPIDDDSSDSIMENNAIDQNTKIEKSNSISMDNISNSDSNLDEKKIDYDDYLNTPPWEERT